MKVDLKAEEIFNNPSKFDRVGPKFLIEFGREGRDLTPVRLLLRRPGRGVGVGDVFRNHPHSPILGLQARGGNK